MRLATDTPARVGRRASEGGSDSALLEFTTSYSVLGPIVGSILAGSTKLLSFFKERLRTGI